MNTIIVWVLITVGGSHRDQVVYSQPMPDLPTCQNFQKHTAEIVEAPYRLKSRCVQIRMVVTK